MHNTCAAGQEAKWLLLLLSKITNFSSNAHNFEENPRSSIQLHRKCAKGGLLLTKIWAPKMVQEKDNDSVFLMTVTRTYFPKRGLAGEPTHL